MIRSSFTPDQMLNAYDEVVGWDDQMQLRLDTAAQALLGFQAPQESIDDLSEQIARAVRERG